MMALLTDEILVAGAQRLAVIEEAHCAQPKSLFHKTGTQKS